MTQDTLKKEAKRLYDKSYNAANREKKLLQSAAWRIANPEKMREYRNQWKSNNPSKHQAAQQKYRDDNRQKTRAAIKLWRKNNPDKKRKNWQRYHARKIGNSTPEQIASADAKILQMFSHPKTLCAYCSQEFITKEMHVDHILALVNGGSHSAENICMACPACNSSKSDNILFEEWQPTQFLLL
jgi:5-methylcytosine-specific restriction endonuclease McrA